MSSSFTLLSVAVVIGVMLAALIQCKVSTRDLRWAAFGYGFILLVTAILGLSGVLSDFSSMPPRLIFFLIGLGLYSALILSSSWTSRVVEAVPLRIFIGLQGFRLLPEYLLHLAWIDGLAPIQMTWHGRNADIVTAGLGLALAMSWKHIKNPRGYAWAFSAVGIALLINIVGIALLSAPTPLRVFMNEPANTFVSTFPYIWLPGIHVFTAIILHGLTLKSLLRSS